MQYNLKHAPPADGYCVSATLANLLDDTSFIDIQKELGLKGMTMNQCAAYFGIYFQPVIVGCKITPAIFDTVLQDVRKKVPHNHAACLSVFIRQDNAYHFVIVLVQSDKLVIIDTLKGVGISSFIFANAIYKQLDGALGLYIQEDVQTSGLELYHIDSLSHLFDNPKQR